MIFRKITIILSLVLLVGCSTKKNTWLSRNYHNLTAYYNVYYNGRESLKNGVKAIQDNCQNDYSDILPLFESSDADAISIATGDMDRAIEKGTKLIKKHSITAKPKKRSGSKNSRSAEFYNRKEYNDWVDNAYLMIGKAQLYKHEFLPAIRTFQYVAREFNNTPAQYEALIWLARTYTEYNDYIGALSALESYDLGGNAPEELYGEFMAVYANLLLKQEKYADAIPYIKNSLTTAKKHRRVRFNYILGQLYAANNQKSQATEAFAYVAKVSTDYEMTFNAKVNRASIIYEDANIEEVKKQLHKLRKDKKNKDYLDRIYWAFGQVFEGEGNTDEALHYYKKSVASSVDNENQKGISYREAGEIYYDRMDFPNAYFYYDSALTVIDQDYELYDQLEERHNGLSGLVDHILIVQREDSLQRLADMSEPVLLAYLDGIIETKEEEQRLAKEREEEDNFNDPFFYQNSGSNSAMNQSGGKWYFYNQASMGMGKMEFQKRWGKRKLEDNWRRSDKSKVQEEEDDFGDPSALPDLNSPEQDTKSADEPANKVDVPANNATAIPTRAQLLADIPQTEEQRVASDELTENSLMEMGLIFMDGLENYPKSIESFEDLLSRYPQAKSREQVLVALYNAYRLNNDTGGMTSARNRLEQEFPDSRFVASLNDPDFFNKMIEMKKQQELAYENTYENFLFGKYNEVINEANEIVLTDKENPLTDKYLLIRALSEGKTGNNEAFKADLETIVGRDENSEEAALASQLLKLLADGMQPVQGTTYSSVPSTSQKSLTKDDTSDESEGDISSEGFVYVENEAYDIVVLSIDKTNLNRAIYNVADYNFSRYLLHDFGISEKVLINGETAIVISGFKNKSEAMDYFYSLRERPEFFKFDFFKDNILAISTSNQNKFYLSGLIKEYTLFFATYYLAPVEKSELEKVSVKPEETQKPDEVFAEPTKEQATSTAELEQSEAVPETIEPVANVPDPVEAEVIEETRPEKAEVDQNVQENSVQREEAIEPVVEKVEEAPLYTYNAEQAHHALIVVKKTRMDYKRFQTIFTNFTRNDYGDKLSVTMVDIGEDYRAIQVDGFKNANEATAYISDVKNNSFLTRDIIRKEHYLWPVSSDNLQNLMTKSLVKEYDNFYKSNYK
ncbi:tetratricopeptide repeat protein [Carboxylicivirga sp. N1Y90]|uniref:type IX secretion system periplasmic lipoprotein PorW/SprE n=1 Tax=Carboxylicivirga fragile TaxID=3417571 RepID=UPI003D34CBB4|nr:hypothetical protein [Marinilabiliaceae bacterium N1Y90]